MLRNAAYKGTLRYNRATHSKWHRHIGGKGGRSVERQDEQSEQRPPEDWIVVDEAWPALIDAALFDQVQAKLDTARREHLCTSGQSLRAAGGHGYLLTGTLCCGVCGGRLMGQTHRSNPPHGRRRIRRRYVCRHHHQGAYELCPTRFSVPADRVESLVIDLIKEDLRQLKGDTQLHQTIAEELRKLCGSQIDARQGLQTRLTDLDGHMAKLTTHLSVLDVPTATTLGLYAKAKALADERRQVQAQLDAVGEGVPDITSPQEVARRADEQFTKLDQLLASGSLEEKKELIRTYVKAGKVDPATQEIELSILPALFTSIGTRGGVGGLP
jgi:hypothetical protein